MGKYVSEIQAELRSLLLLLKDFCLLATDL